MCSPWPEMQGKMGILSAAYSWKIPPVGALQSVMDLDSLLKPRTCARPLGRESCFQIQPRSRLRNKNCTSVSRRTGPCMLPRGRLWIPRPRMPAFGFNRRNQSSATVPDNVVITTHRFNHKQTGTPEQGTCAWTFTELSTTRFPATCIYLLRSCPRKTSRLQDELGASRTAAPQPGLRRAQNEPLYYIR